jgi:hypothetical protein
VILRLTVLLLLIVVLVMVGVQAIQVGHADRAGHDLADRFGDTLGTASMAAPTLPSPRYAPLDRPFFVENRGQLAEPVRFATPGGRSPVFVTDHSLVLRLEADGPIRDECADDPPVGVHLFLGFEGVAETARAEGLGPLATRLHYFRGNDPEAWVRNAPTWERVRYRDLYAGIDAELYWRDGVLEYDLLVEPGADLGDVVVRVRGAEELSLAADGALVIHTAVGPVTQAPPETFELLADGTRRPRACAYRRIDSERFGFTLAGMRTPAALLVVDPRLAYSTYLGGNVFDLAFSVDVDATGHAYVSGPTASADFPVTPGAFQTALLPDDSFVARLSPDGTALIYSSFLGGTGFTDTVDALVVDGMGQALVAGRTNSMDYPTTRGAYDETYNGGVDVFVTKFTADGSDLVYSTYVGGTDSDGWVHLAQDSLGRAVVAGSGESFDFPVTPDAYQSTHSGVGSNDGFLFRLTPDGAGLSYSTYLFGGIMHGLALDARDVVYVTGQTGDVLPTTPGAFDETYNFGVDAYVARFEIDGSGLVWCSFLGGGVDEFPEGIAVDASGAPVVVGRTNSNGFPTTTGAFDTTYAGSVDGFVTRFLPDGSDLSYSGFLGGGGGDVPNDVKVLPGGEAVVVGSTGSSNFPVTADAHNPVFNVSTEAFLVKIAADGSEVLYGTYLGGADQDQALDYAFGVALDTDGAAYVVGQTFAHDFPLTPGAADPIYDGGSSEAFVTKFDFSPWCDLGFSYPGTGGLAPKLTGTGTLVGNEPIGVALEDALPGAAANLVVGTSAINFFPFYGGTLVPAFQPPGGFFVTLFANGAGELTINDTWPTGLPAGLELYLQYWIVDPGAAFGLSASNAVLGVAAGD